MIARFYYYWRVASTGFCFACFGLGGLLMSISVFPLLWLLPINQPRKKIIAQYIIHLSFGVFVSMMALVGAMKVRVSGWDRLANREDLFIVSNHPSLIDVVVLVSLLKRADCIIKQGVWNNPFMFGVVSSAGYICNRSPEQLLASCEQSLRSGSSLIVFPEGTRSRPGEPLRFQRGAANVALRAGKAITPVKIKMSPTTLTKSDRWYDVPRQCCPTITVSFGEDIGVETFGEDSLALGSRKLTRHLEEYFTKEIMANE